MGWEEGLCHNCCEGVIEIQLKNFGNGDGFCEEFREWVCEEFFERRQLKAVIGERDIM